MAAGSTGNLLLCMGDSSAGAGRGHADAAAVCSPAGGPGRKRGLGALPICIAATDGDATEDRVLLAAAPEAARVGDLA